MEKKKKQLFIKRVIEIFKKGDLFTRLSFLIMGCSQTIRGQWFKGILYFTAEIGFLFYMVQVGGRFLVQLRHLGTKKQEMVIEDGMPVLQKGDNSMLLLLGAVVAIFIVVAFVIVWYKNIQSAYKVQQLKENNKHIPGLKEELASYLDTKIHKTLLFFPVLGILIFNILPLLFMILIAFTNYNKDHQPPGNLFTWVGLSNFKNMLSNSNIIGKTFWSLLLWTFIWAIFATFLNYFLGMILAIIINRKETKFKRLWRTIFVFSIAVPQFVSLLVMRSMLQEEGPVNILLRQIGLLGAEQSLPFFSDPLWAKVTCIVVNLWVGIPYTLLITTGILQNIPEELYESAKMDGAGPARIFRKITLPYMLFVTTPYLITQFIGNLNNFNVIFLLTGGNPVNLRFHQAGDTDLLVTWLYKLTVNSFDYNYASVIGIFVFIISVIISLVTYHNTKSYKDEGGFQ